MHDDSLTPKKRQIRKRILQTASKVFAVEGLHNADVQVIADLACVGKGTIYRHFGNKAKLFLAVTKFNVDQVAEYVRGAAIESDSVVARLRGIALASAEFVQQHPESVEIVIQERAEFHESLLPTHLMRRAEGQARPDNLFRRGIESGEFIPIDATAADNAFYDMLFGALVCGCLGGTRNQLVERVRQATEIFLRGICAATIPEKENTACRGDEGHKAADGDIEHDY